MTGVQTCALPISNENYFARQAILEQDVEGARKRYEAAMKRWNDLK